MLAEIGHYRLRYAFRGPEYAFVIRQGDLPALEEVARLCSQFWNGSNSLIIPADARGRLLANVDHLLMARPVEQFVLHPGLSERARTVIEERFAPRTERLSERTAAHYLHPLDLQQSFVDPSAPRRELPVARYPTPRLRRLATVVCGDIASEDRPYVDEAFNVVEYRASQAHEAMLRAQLERSSPLAQAAELIRMTSESPPLESRRLMVIDRANFGQLLYFWTIRGGLPPLGDGPRVIGLPVEAFEDDQVDLATIRSWVEASPVPEKPELLVSVSARRAEVVRKRLTGLGFVEYTGTTVRRYFGDPPTGRETVEFAIWNAGVPSQERGLEQTDLAVLAPGRNYLRLRPPAAFASRRFRYGGLMAVDIKDLPVPLPLNRTAAGRMISNADGYGQHLVVTTSATPNDLYFDDFTLPTPQETLADFLAQFGRTARPSPHGHLAATLLGRLESLHDLDIVASGLGEQIVRFLSGTDTSGRLTPRLLAQVASGVHRGGRACGTALAALVRHGFVQRGIQARCSVCQFVDFFLFAELDEHVQCRGCRSSFGLPATDENGRETPISYQLDSLTARTIALDVFPVLQAIRRLVPEGQLPSGHALWPGIEILRTGRPDIELELDALLGRGQTVTICEAKTRAEGLSVDQVRRIVGFADEIGADVVFYSSDGQYSTRVQEFAQAHGARLIS